MRFGPAKEPLAVEISIDGGPMVTITTGALDTIDDVERLYREAVENLKEPSHGKARQSARRT